MSFADLIASALIHMAFFGFGLSEPSASACAARAEADKPSHYNPKNVQFNPLRFKSAAALERLILLVVAGFILFAVGLIVACYPLGPWPLAAILATYAALLWYRPAAFLIVIPVVLPAYDLGLWTGWMMIGESDLFILITIAILIVRNPPQAIDWKVTGISGTILLLFVTSWVTATAIGLCSNLAPSHSDNVFLRPDNALRLAKSLVEALILLPHLRRRQRVSGDADLLLTLGIVAGLGVVTLIVLCERALFATIFDFSTTYRVAGPFSSMRVGGGHIGAYAALALPFSLTLFQFRPKWAAACLVLLGCLCGGYTLTVTFARTGYAAGMVAMTITSLGLLWVANHRRIRSMAFSTLPLAMVLIALVATAAFTGMHDRIAATAADFLTRKANWQAGLAVRDHDVATTLFGMGLGSYQRTMLMRSQTNRPTDLALNQDDAGTYVSMRVETPFFLGQKVSLPSTGPLHLSLRARATDGDTTLGAAMCDKVLLYSDNCRGTETRLAQPGQWMSLDTTISTQGLGGQGLGGQGLGGQGLGGQALGGQALGGLLHRPVELSLYGSIGHRIDIRDVALTDDAGQAVLRNGSFNQGLDHWIFTDDSHVSWRMLNQYLMLFFETGILGLAAYLTFCGLALAGALRSLRSGNLTGAAIAGSISGFLISGLFDNVLEAPRLATLFFLICSCGLMNWDATRPQAVKSRGQ